MSTLTSDFGMGPAYTRRDIRKGRVPLEFYHSWRAWKRYFRDILPEDLEMTIRQAAEYNYRRLILLVINLMVAVLFIFGLIAVRPMWISLFFFGCLCVTAIIGWKYDEAYLKNFKGIDEAFYFDLRDLHGALKGKLKGGIPLLCERALAVLAVPARRIRHESRCLDNNSYPLEQRCHHAASIEHEKKELVCLHAALNLFVIVEEDPQFYIDHAFDFPVLEMTEEDRAETACSCKADEISPAEGSHVLERPVVPQHAAMAGT